MRWKFLCSAVRFGAQLQPHTCARRPVVACTPLTHSNRQFSCKADVNIVRYLRLRQKILVETNRISSEWRTIFCCCSSYRQGHMYYVTTVIIASTIQLAGKRDCGFSTPNQNIYRPMVSSHLIWPLCRFRTNDKYDSVQNVRRWTRLNELYVTWTWTDKRGSSSLFAFTGKYLKMIRANATENYAMLRSNVFPFHQTFMWWWLAVE